MDKNYAEEFRSDLAEFREKTKLFYEGKLSVPEYKGFSGGFGSYDPNPGRWRGESFPLWRKSTLSISWAVLLL